MQITTAAITTRQDGNVYNVFQVCSTTNLSALKRIWRARVVGKPLARVGPLQSALMTSSHLLLSNPCIVSLKKGQDILYIIAFGSREHCRALLGTSPLKQMWS